MTGTKKSDKRYTMIYVGVVKPDISKVQDLYTSKHNLSISRDVISALFDILYVPEVRTYIGDWNQIKAQYSDWRDKGMLKQTEEDGRIFFAIFENEVRFKEPKPLSESDRKKIEDARAKKAQVDAEERRGPVREAFVKKHGELKPKSKEEVDRHMRKLCVTANAPIGTEVACIVQGS